MVVQTEEVQGAGRPGARAVTDPIHSRALWERPGVRTGWHPIAAAPGGPRSGASVRVTEMQEMLDG